MNTRTKRISAGIALGLSALVLGSGAMALGLATDRRDDAPASVERTVEMPTPSVTATPTPTPEPVVESAPAPVVEAPVPAPVVEEPPYVEPAPAPAPAPEPEPFVPAKCPAGYQANAVDDLGNESNCIPAECWYGTVDETRPECSNPVPAARGEQDWTA